MWEPPPALLDQWSKEARPPRRKQAPSCTPPVPSVRPTTHLCQSADPAAAVPTRASGLKSEDPENARLRHESYRDLQRGFAGGKVRCVGVSNFNQRHLEALLADPSITHPPRVNQVEVHPFFPQRTLRAFFRSQDQGILVQAYSSLGQNDPTLREHPVVLEIAAHRGMTPAQVLLRWALDQGMPVIPKTTTPTRMAENLAALTCPPLHAEDMAALAGLERASGGKLAWDPAKVV